MLEKVCIPLSYFDGNIRTDIATQNFSQKSLMSESLALDYNPLTAHSKELNEAITFHLLREGEFEVASILQDEMQREPSEPSTMPKSPTPLTNMMLNQPGIFSMFRSMYEILDQIRARNLLPAIEWARSRSELLEKRDSTLEFDLMKLQYVWIFQGARIDGMPMEGLYAALEYARENFGRFSKRFSSEIQQLSAAVAFHSNIPDSPYRLAFEMDDAFNEMSISFTRDFCSLLGMSAESPLYVAVTAGAIALPTLEKMVSIMKDKRTEWTTAHEMPVELPLPDSMTFHQIFVCPVSKEQATDANPPMRMECGHVLARESIHAVSKNGNRFKCPYCPHENSPKEAKKIYL